MDTLLRVASNVLRANVPFSRDWTWSGEAVDLDIIVVVPGCLVQTGSHAVVRRWWLVGRSPVVLPSGVSSVVVVVAV